ncbi:hypothetical protein V6Z11_D01G110500 [Gossypium hirsutum]
MPKSGLKSFKTPARKFQTTRNLSVSGHRSSGVAPSAVVRRFQREKVKIGEDSEACGAVETLGFLPVVWATVTLGPCLFYYLGHIGLSVMWVF